MYSLVVVEILTAVLAAPRNQLHLVLGVVEAAKAASAAATVQQAAVGGRAALAQEAQEVLVVAVAALLPQPAARVGH